MRTLLPVFPLDLVAADPAAADADADADAAAIALENWNDDVFDTG